MAYILPAVVVVCMTHSDNVYEKSFRFDICGVANVRARFFCFVVVGGL